MRGGPPERIIAHRFRPRPRRCGSPRRRRCDAAGRSCASGCAPGASAWRSTRRAARRGCGTTARSTPRTGPSRIPGTARSRSAVHSQTPPIICSTPLARGPRVGRGRGALEAEVEPRRRRRRRVAPRIAVLAPAVARGVFPLALRGQPAPGPAAPRLRLVAVHLHDGIVRPQPLPGVEPAHRPAIAVALPVPRGRRARHVAPAPAFRRPELVAPVAALLHEREELAVASPAARPSRRARRALHAPTSRCRRRARRRRAGRPAGIRRRRNATSRGSPPAGAGARVVRRDAAPASPSVCSVMSSASPCMSSWKSDSRNRWRSSSRLRARSSSVTASVSSR